jgi:hypothetical protein
MRELCHAGGDTAVTGRAAVPPSKVAAAALAGEGTGALERFHINWKQKPL